MSCDVVGECCNCHVTLMWFVNYRALHRSGVVLLMLGELCVFIFSLSVSVGSKEGS